MHCVFKRGKQFKWFLNVFGHRVFSVGAKDRNTLSDVSVQNRKLYVLLFHLTCLLKIRSFVISTE